MFIYLGISQFSSYYFYNAFANRTFLVFSTVLYGIFVWATIAIYPIMMFLNKKHTYFYFNNVKCRARGCSFFIAKGIYFVVNGMLHVIRDSDLRLALLLAAEVAFICYFLLSLFKNYFDRKLESAYEMFLFFLRVLLILSFHIAVFTKIEPQNPLINELHITLFIYLFSTQLFALVFIFIRYFMKKYNKMVFKDKKPKHQLNYFFKFKQPLG